jgi:hypothetical protein
MVPLAAPPACRPRRGLRRTCSLAALPVLDFLAGSCRRARPQPTPVHRRFCCSGVRTHGRAHGRSNARRCPHHGDGAWHHHNSCRFCGKGNEKHQGRKSLHALTSCYATLSRVALKACRYAPWEPQFIDFRTSVTLGAHGVDALPHDAPRTRVASLRCTTC